MHYKCTLNTFQFRHTSFSQGDPFKNKQFICEILRASSCTKSYAFLTYLRIGHVSQFKSSASVYLSIICSKIS